MNAKKVTTASTMLRAVMIENALENAGIPVIIHPAADNAYLDICVPEAFVYDAMNLLTPEARNGELYSAQACA